MATMLKSPVTRELDRPAANGKTLKVTLEPGNLITMWEKGKRTKYTGSLERVYAVLARWHADKEIEERNKQKQLRKMGLA